MPTYEYKCSSCSHTFEIFQSIKAEALKECPKCKGELKRLIGPGARPIFKGSGFYQTDYKNSENKTVKKTSSDKNKDSSAKATTESKNKTESK
jgi:putative FmdB family regulatory protein